MVSAHFERDDEAPVGPYFAAEVQDDLLRMLFIYCSETIPPESRLVLALKTLCGFSTAEIALRLFTTQANVNGDVFSRYHAEAGLAAEHCRAPAFAETRWHEIVDLYSMLEALAPSPLHTLNKAVAVAECQGHAARLAVLEGMVPPSWLAGSYLWDEKRAK